MKAKITIGLMNSTDPKFNNQFHITIQNEDYFPLMEVVVSPHNLGLALSGLACRECEIIESEVETE